MRDAGAVAQLPKSIYIYIYISVPVTGWTPVPEIMARERGCYSLSHLTTCEKTLLSVWYFYNIYFFIPIQNEYLFIHLSSKLFRFRKNNNHLFKLYFFHMRNPISNMNSINLFLCYFKIIKV